MVSFSRQLGLAGNTKTYTLDNMVNGSVTASDGSSDAGFRVDGAIAGQFDVTLSVDFGALDQDVTFTAKLVDAAGNETAEVSETVTIDRTGPVFTQTSPRFEGPPSEVFLVSSDDALFGNFVEGLPILDVEFSYSITGLAAGDAVTLVVKHYDNATGNESSLNLFEDVLVNGSSFGGLNGVFQLTTTVDGTGTATS